jgi:CRP-like cAMP-binding protein
MESLEQLLREHPFLKELSEEQIRFMVSCAKNLRFQPGHFLVREGGEADVLYLIRSGRVALEIAAPGKSAFLLESLEAGDILGLSWIFPPNRWDLDARAVEPVSALSFDAGCLRAKMEQDPVFGYAFSKLLIHRIVERLKRVRLQRLDLYRAEP